MLEKKYRAELNNNRATLFVVVIKVLRKLKHYAVLFLKRLLRLVVFVTYDKTRLKYIDQKNKLKKILFDSFSYSPILYSNDTISIALILRNGDTHPTSSAFIRLISPLSKLQSAGKLHFRIYKHNTTKLKDGHDICIIQRTAYDSKDKAKKLVLNLKKQSTKLIVDNDDAFTLIDKRHAEYHTQASRTKALDYLVKNADQVWVSTKNLANLYYRLNKNTKVVANSLDQTLWQDKGSAQQKQAAGAHLSLVYMGTATHDDDFKMIFESLKRLHKNYPNNFKLYIIGVSSKTLPEESWIERLYQPSGYAIYPKFVKWFKQQGPFDIGLCPLIESDFNRYKSDIKCLDYFGIGAFPFASNVDSYKTEDLSDLIRRIDNSSESWYRELEKAVSNPKAFRKVGLINSKKSQHYLWNQRSVNVSTNQIFNLLKELLSN